MSKNNVESIRSRLKNIADSERKPFDFILMLYLVERLLFRMSISRYSEPVYLLGRSRFLSLSFDRFAS